MFGEMTKAARCGGESRLVRKLFCREISHSDLVSS